MPQIGSACPFPPPRPTPQSGLQSCLYNSISLSFSPPQLSIILLPPSLPPSLYRFLFFPSTRVLTFEPGVVADVLGAIAKVAQPPREVRSEQLRDQVPAARAALVDANSPATQPRSRFASMTQRLVTRHGAQCQIRRRRKTYGLCCSIDHWCAGPGLLLDVAGILDLARQDSLVQLHAIIRVEGRVPARTPIRRASWMCTKAQQACRDPVGARECGRLDTFQRRSVRPALPLLPPSPDSIHRSLSLKGAGRGGGRTRRASHK